MEAVLGLLGLILAHLPDLAYHSWLTGRSRGGGQPGGGGAGPAGPYPGAFA